MKLLDLFCGEGVEPVPLVEVAPVAPQIEARPKIKEIPSRHEPEAEDDWPSYWRSVCPDYWEGCFSCADFRTNRKEGKPDTLVFCSRHPRPAWAKVIQ